MSFDDLFRRDRLNKTLERTAASMAVPAKVSAPGWRQCLFRWHRPNKSFKPTATAGGLTPTLGLFTELRSARIRG